MSGGGGEEEGPNALTLQVGNPPKKKMCLHAFIVVLRRTFSSERKREREREGQSSKTFLWYQSRVYISYYYEKKKMIRLCSAALPSVLMLD